MLVYTFQPQSTRNTTEQVGFITHFNEDEPSLEGGLTEVPLGLGTKHGLLTQPSAAWWAVGRGAPGARQEQPQGQGASRMPGRAAGTLTSLPGPLLGRPAPSTLGLRVGWGQRPLLRG